MCPTILTFQHLSGRLKALMARNTETSSNCLQNSFNFSTDHMVCNKILQSCCTSFLILTHEISTSLLFVPQESSIYLCCSFSLEQPTPHLLCLSEDFAPIYHHSLCEPSQHILVIPMVLHFVTYWFSRLYLCTYTLRQVSLCYLLSFLRSLLPITQKTAF